MSWEPFFTHRGSLIEFQVTGRSLYREEASIIKGKKETKSHTYLVGPRSAGSPWRCYAGSPYDLGETDSDRFTFFFFFFFFFY